MNANEEWRNDPERRQAAFDSIVRQRDLYRDHVPALRNAHDFMLAPKKPWGAGLPEMIRREQAMVRDALRQAEQVLQFLTTSVEDGVDSIYVGNMAAFGETL